MLTRFYLALANVRMIIALKNPRLKSTGVAEQIVVLLYTLLKDHRGHTNTGISTACVANVEFHPGNARGKSLLQLLLLNSLSEKPALSLHLSLQFGGFSAFGRTHSASRKNSRVVQTPRISLSPYIAYFLFPFLTLTSIIE